MTEWEEKNGMRSKTMNMSEGRPLKLLTQQPFGSLGMALTTYAGQNYGARHTDRVREMGGSAAETGLHRPRLKKI